jgi:hypothetical protein
MAQLIYQSAIFVDYLTFAILSLECHDEIIWFQIDRFLMEICVQVLVIGTYYRCRNIQLVRLI